MKMDDTYHYPNTGVFYRALDREFPKIVRGEGCWLIDHQGRRYLDACGGAYVTNLGHGVSEIADAVAKQIHKVAYVNGTAFTNEPAEELAADGYGPREKKKKAPGAPASKNEIMELRSKIKKAEEVLDKLKDEKGNLLALFGLNT
jgi:hypothetical protein